MESRFFTVSSQKNQLVTIQVAAGHFATASAHISHYIDISELKSSSGAAKSAARELAIPCRATTVVDVIVCLEGTEIIAAYLADELLLEGIDVMNAGGEIHVVSPMVSPDGHFIFHENIQKIIRDRNVILLVATISSGVHVCRAMECISYYGGRLIGVSAVFSAFPKVCGMDVCSLFSGEDVPGYQFFAPAECKMCRDGKALDAIIDSEGYTKVQEPGSPVPVK